MDLSEIYVKYVLLNSFFNDYATFQNLRYTDNGILHATCGIPLWSILLDNSEVLFLAVSFCISGSVGWIGKMSDNSS